MIEIKQAYAFDFLCYVAGDPFTCFCAYFQWVSELYSAFVFSFQLLMLCCIFFFKCCIFLKWFTVGHFV